MLAESSTVARWELALRIKKRRDELGLKAEQIAKELGFTRNFFSAVENERAMLAPEKLEILMEILRLDNVERAEYRELDRVGRIRGWWESHEELLGEGGVRYLGLEQGAVDIRQFDPIVIPGLLQHDLYYKAIIGRDPMIGRAQVETMLSIRARRQESVLPSVSYSALMSEAALVQQWGNSDVHRNQLRHILDIIHEFPNVDVRVLSFECEPGIIVTTGTLALLRFGSPHLPEVAYQEALHSLGLLYSSDEQFRRLQIAWEDSFELAASREDTERRIASLI